MKKLKHIPVNLIIFCALLGCCHNSYSQKDTLHIYYLGSQTNVLDSNDVKITKWAKTLKGKHYDVEIYAYYDNSDFKKFMAERAENLELVVNRKVRDLITIKFSGPMKGKRWQRNMADVVFTSDGSHTPPPQEKKEEKKSDEGESKGTDTKGTSSSKNTESSEKKEEAVEKEETAKPASVRPETGYYMDSVYVNGVLKVTKRKVKKK